MRERLFTMRMSEDEHSRLDELAKHYGLNAAGTIRMLVKREHDGLSDVRATKTIKKKKSQR